MVLFLYKKVLVVLVLVTKKNSAWCNAEVLELAGDDELQYFVRAVSSSFIESFKHNSSSPERKKQLLLVIISVIDLL